MFSSLSNIDFYRLESSIQSIRKPAYVKKIQNGHNFGKKYRRGIQYAKEAEVDRLLRVAKEQRKKLKVNHDSWRRSDIPDEKNEQMENLYYANFLGDKYGDNGTHYNNKFPVNLKFCDSMVEDSQEERRIEEENFEEVYEYHLNFVQEEEERRIEEANFEEMYEYLLNKKREKDLTERHIYLVMSNGYTRDEAELLVGYHESLNIGGLCDEALCPHGWRC